MSALIYQLFFTPDVGTLLHVELCQTDRSVSVLLTTKVMTVYCIGTVRKKQFSFFFNFEMNKSTTAEKIKIKFSKLQFFFLPFSEIFGGDLVKQLNKFVWPYEARPCHCQALTLSMGPGRVYYQSVSDLSR